MNQYVKKDMLKEINVIVSELKCALEEATDEVEQSKHQHAIHHLNQAKAEIKSIKL